MHTCIVAEKFEKIAVKGPSMESGSHQGIGNLPTTLKEVVYLLYDRFGERVIIWCVAQLEP